jgi:hypothetical protein
VNTTATAALPDTGFIHSVQSHEEGANANDEHHHTVLVRAGDVVTTLADVSTGHIYFAVNGNWQQQHQQQLHSNQLLPSRSDLTSDSNTTVTAAPVPVVPLRPLLTIARGDASSKAVVNFGAVPFKHAPPADNALCSGWQAVVERPDVASHWPAVTAPSVTEQSVSVAPEAAAVAADVLPPLSLSRGSSPTTATATAAAKGSSSNSSSSCLTPPRGSALNTAPVRADASSPPFIFRAASPAAAAPKLVAVREESLPESPLMTAVTAPLQQQEQANEQQQQQQQAQQEQQEKPLVASDAPVLPGALPVVDPVNWGFRFVAEPLMGVQYRVSAPCFLST